MLLVGYVALIRHGSRDAHAADYEGGPAGLVGGTEAAAGVAVEVFVEPEQELWLL